MHHRHFAPAGAAQAQRLRHPFIQAVHRAPVNIYKTENSYEMMVFAPGRVKEHFSVNVKEKQLTISYQPAGGVPSPDWIFKEYSRGGFERVFHLDESVDSASILATYTDGVLKLSLPILPGKESSQQDIPVN